MVLDTVELEQELTDALSSLKVSKTIAADIDILIEPVVLKYMNQNPIHCVSDYIFQTILVDGDGPIEGSAGAERGNNGNITLIIPDDNLDFVIQNNQHLDILKSIIIKTITHEAIHWLQFGRNNSTNLLRRRNFLYTPKQEINIKVIAVFGFEIPNDLYFGDILEIEALSHTIAMELMEYWINDGYNEKDAAYKSIDILRDTSYMNWIMHHESDVLNELYHSLQSSASPKAEKLWKRYMKEIYTKLISRAL